LLVHQKPTGSHEDRKALQHDLVVEGRSRAALVFDGPNAVGWCKYGRPADLPRIYHKKAYDQAVREQPDWRITCFFIDRDYRRSGVARVALQGALELIAHAGGGLVESFPAETGGRKTSASFLYNATVSLFEQMGFERIEQIGKSHWLVVRRVAERSGGWSRALPVISP
jgi:ribosomal protein S18 acetylase RimI-like enzyme